MCTYLDQVGSTYYFRRPVPLDLRGYFLTKTGKPRVDWKKTLRTKDRETAKRKIPEYITWTNAEIDAARAQLATQQAAAQPRTPEELEEQRRTIERRRYADERELVEMGAQEELAAWEADQGATREARIKNQEEYAKRLRTRITGSTADMAPEDAVIARLLREHQADAAFWKQIANDREFALEQIRAAGVARDSQDGDTAPALPTTLPKFSIASQRPSEGKSGVVTITGLFEMYGAQDGIAPGTVKQWRNYINHLVRFLGHDDAARVTGHDMVGWREKLRTEKTKAGKPLSSKTINGSYLAAASVTFAYGLNQLLLRENPMTGIQPVRADKKPMLRDRDFTKAEREAILKAALFLAKGKLTPERALARRWVPWLCAYSGARVNEMTQLRAEDVAEIEGVWTIRVTPEAGPVKTRKARTVPLHEHLIEQGFLNIVRSMTGPLFYNPDKARGGNDGRHHKKVGMFLASWVRKDVGITDPDVAPNHGWRHTFKTICREAEIDESAADYIQGHAHKGQGRKYGSNTIPALAKQLAKFPRFETD